MPTIDAVDATTRAKAPGSNPAHQDLSPQSPSDSSSKNQGLYRDEKSGSDHASHERPLRTRTTSFKFLSLPPELRNEVYRHLLLATNQPITENSSAFPQEDAQVYIEFVNLAGPARLGTPSSFTNGLLSTNRQIHHEASSILYGENTFRGDGFCIGRFILQIGKSADLLRSLSITDFEFIVCFHSRIWWLRWVPSLRRLELQWRRSWVGLDPPEKRVMLLATVVYFHLRKWIETVGLSCGDKLAAVKWIHVTYQEPFKIDLKEFRECLIRIIENAE